MKSFKDYLLTEGFKNLFFADKDQREKYADAVWDMLQLSYKKIGGIKGNGFNSKQEMIDKIPFWKIATVKGEPVAVVFYKDKAGRKTVAGATNGSSAGKMKYKEMAEQEFKRGWGEKSHAALGFVKKRFPDLVKKYAIPAEKVLELVGPKKAEAYRLIPGEKYEFEHKIGGEWIRKMAMGTPGKKITQ